MDSSPNDSFLKYLDTYFDKEPRLWSVSDFNTFFKKSPNPKPNKNYSPLESWQHRLKKIANKTPPFDTSSPDKVEAAKTLLKPPPKRKPSKPGAPGVVNYGTIFSGQTEVSGTDVLIGEGNSINRVFEDTLDGRPPKRSRTTNPGEVQPSEDAIPPPSATTEVQGAEYYQYFEALGSVFDSEEPDLQLPSECGLRVSIKAALANKNPHDLGGDFFDELRARILFLDRPEFLRILSPTDVLYLRQMIPRIPDVASTFNDSFQAHQEYIDTADICKLPACPALLDQAHYAEWAYIHAAVFHFRQYWSTIESRAPWHGEGWCDANIWAHLLDTAFLSSQTLSLDRKELQSIVDQKIIVPSKKPNYDGIMRSASLNPACRLDLGFIEVKPIRAPYPKCSATDRQKVIAAMTAALSRIKKLVTDPESMKKVVVIGVICNGTSMTILRAWNLWSDFFFFQENTLELHIKSLESMLKVCWRIKLALERTYEIYVKAEAAKQSNW